MGRAEVESSGRGGGRYSNPGPAGDRLSNRATPPGSRGLATFGGGKISKVRRRKIKLAVHENVKEQR